MLISARATSVLFESAEAEGIRREDLVRPLGLDPAPLSDPSKMVPWAVLVDILEVLREQVGGDVERIRRMGRHMPGVPSYAPLQRLARATLSLGGLYRVGERWMVPAMFPHLVLFHSVRGGRLRIRVEIPEPHRPSEPFLRIAEGAMAAMPTLLGLDAAELVESRVTPRTMDALYKLPANRSVAGLLGRVAGLVRGREVKRLLEAQRRVQVTTIDTLQRAHDELRTLLDNLPSMVLVHAEGRVRWVNRLLVRTLGYDQADDLIGKPVELLVDGRSREVLEKASVEGGTDEARIEGSFLDRQGRSVLVDLAPSQSVVFGGSPALLLIGRDITERVRLQQQLVTADRLASVGLLAAGVAHEVNNPLAYILNNIEIAQRQLTSLGPSMEASRSALGVAMTGVDRIRFIVRELLVLARGDSTSLGPIDVIGAVESTLALAKSEIAKVARLEHSFESVPPVMGNTARVSQVVLNLVLNGLQAMGPSAPEANVLTVRVLSAGDPWVAIEVSDTGTGISGDALARVFDPFYTTKPAGQGTGLGLAISQRLVTELGGEISVSSVVGKGSTFRVLLPAVRRPRREPDATDSSRVAERA